MDSGGHEATYSDVSVMAKHGILFLGARTVSGLFLVLQKR